MSRWYLCMILLAPLAGCGDTKGTAATAASGGQAGSPTYVGRPETARSQEILNRVKGSEDNQAATRR